MSRVASVLVTVSPRSINVGEKARVFVDIHDERGQPVTDQYVSITADPDAVAFVDLGYVIGLCAGTVTITAVCDGVSDAAALSVTVDNLRGRNGRT